MADVRLGVRPREWVAGGSIVAMATQSEIDKTVRRVHDVPEWLLRAKACPECFALLPADQGAVSAHKDWHQRTGTER